MDNKDRWAIWDAAPMADEETCNKHFTAFVNKFVQKSRRERWLHYLLKRPNHAKRRNLSNQLEKQLESACYTYIEYSKVDQVFNSLAAIAKKAV